MPFVYSTLTSSVRYTNHRPGGGDLPVPVTVDGHEGVLIEGGRGVASKRLITPLGVSTEVSDSQLAYLLENSTFQLHQTNGFITVQDKNSDPEKVAANMESGDGSAPLTPSDFTKDSAPKVSEAKPVKAKK